MSTQNSAVRIEESRQHIARICEKAVTAVMRQGRFEASGAIRLVVMRRGDIMISYRTPFNPLPTLSDTAKFRAVSEGRFAQLKPYGIDIWQVDVGKVLSAGWADGETPAIDIYFGGEWERWFRGNALQTGATRFARDRFGAPSMSSERPVRQARRG